MWSRQVLLGRPATLRGLPELASGPAFSTAAGLLSWAAGDGRAVPDINLDGEAPIGLFSRFVNFLKERVCPRRESRISSNNNQTAVPFTRGREQNDLEPDNTADEP